MAVSRKGHENPAQIHFYLTGLARTYEEHWRASSVASRTVALVSESVWRCRRANQTPTPP